MRRAFEFPSSEKATAIPVPDYKITCNQYVIFYRWRECKCLRHLQGCLQISAVLAKKQYMTVHTLLIVDMRRFHAAASGSNLRDASQSSQPLKRVIGSHRPQAERDCRADARGTKRANPTRKYQGRTAAVTAVTLCVTHGIVE